MVPQSCIINYLKIYKTSGGDINFIEKTIKTWRVELTGGEKILITITICNSDDATQS